MRKSVEIKLALILSLRDRKDKIFGLCITIWSATGRRLDTSSWLGFRVDTIPTKVVGQGGRGKWDSDQPDQDEAILNPRLVSQNHPKVETFVHNRQQNVTLPDLIFTVPKILSFVKKKMGACYRFSGQEIYW